MRHKGWGMELLSYITNISTAKTVPFLSLPCKSAKHSTWSALCSINTGYQDWGANKQNSSSEPSTFWLSIPLPYLGTHSMSCWASFLILYSSVLLMITARATVWSWTGCLLHKFPSWRGQVRAETQSTATKRICHQCPDGKASYLWSCFANARGVAPSLRKSLEILPRSSQGKWSELQ